MLQRNDTGYPITSYDMGQEIWPGEVFDFPEHITGCTILGQPDAGDASAEPPTEPAEAAELAAPEDATPQQPAEDEGAPPPGDDAPQGDPETDMGSEGEGA